MFFSQTAGSVTTNFLGIVISVMVSFRDDFALANLAQGFGYTALKAQLFTAPNYAVQVTSATKTSFTC